MNEIETREYLINSCIDSLAYVNKRIATGTKLLESFDSDKKHSNKTTLSYEAVEKVIAKYNKQRCSLRKVLKSLNYGRGI